MKKFTILLVMISIATLAYNQSSRRTTSANNNTDRTHRSRTETHSSNREHSPQVNRSTQARSNTTRTQTNRTHSSQPKSTNVNRHTTSRHTTNSRAHSNHAHSRSYTTPHYSYYHKPKSYCHTSEYKLRVPTHINVVWTSNMHRHYVNMYPNHRSWHYSYGSRITSIPSYDARYHVGHVRSVYGRVNEVFYYRETDEYVLFVGRYYPNQHFTVVVPGNLARKHSRRPADYYLHRDIQVTGLISSYEGKPELLVKRDSQLCMY